MSKRACVVLLALSLPLACDDDDGGMEPSDLVPVAVGSHATGNGTISSPGYPLNCVINGLHTSGVCEISVAPLSDVTLRATASTGMVFGGWSGACASFQTAFDCALTVDEPTVVSAAFIPAQRYNYLYLSTASGVSELWVRLAGTTEPRRVLPIGTEILDVATTRDGDIVAVVRRDETGRRSIWTMRPNGSQMAPLISDEFENFDPAFAPDGHKIAYVSTRQNPGGDIWVVDRNLANPRNLTPDQGGVVTSDRSPAWSADGTRIAFGSDRGGVSRIWVMNADGTLQTSESGDSGSDTQPTWAPTGTAIAFVRTVSGEGSNLVVHDLLYGIDAVFPRNGNERDPMWSWDGARIAYASDEDGDLELYTMLPTGSDIVRITDNQIPDRRPVFLQGIFVPPGPVR